MGGRPGRAYSSRPNRAGSGPHRRAGRAPEGLGRKPRRPVSAADAALSAVLLATCAAATVTDLRERRIPNRLTGPAALAAFVLGCALDLDGQPARLVAGAAATAFFGVAATVSPQGMGMGDAKLAGVIGLCLGPEGTVVAVLAALAAGSLYGIATLVRHGRQARKAAIPFGPFLALGAVAGVVPLLLRPAPTPPPPPPSATARASPRPPPA